MFKTIITNRNSRSQAEVYSDRDFEGTLRPVSEIAKRIAFNARELEETGDYSILDDIMDNIREMRRTKTEEKQIAYRVAKRDYLLDVILSNTEIGNLYGQSDLIRGCEEVFNDDVNTDQLPYERNGSIWSCGFDVKMVLTVLGYLIDDGTFKCSKTGERLFYTRVR